MLMDMKVCVRPVCSSKQQGEQTYLPLVMCFLQTWQLVLHMRPQVLRRTLDRSISTMAETLSRNSPVKSHSGYAHTYIHAERNL